MIQSEAVLYIVFMLGAYLLGSVPTGILVAKALGGADPRTSGSRNIGATNVGRTLGRTAGVLTLLGDIVKGAVPVYLATRVMPETLFVSLVAFSAFAGHLFPVFLGFRGGKGVATACGVMAVISPPAILLSAVVFVIVVAVKRYVSLGSMIAAGLLPLFLSVVPGGRAYVPVGSIIAALVILKHSENIRRLISGTENRIFKGKR